ncbi:MAG: peptidoglycan-binding protein [Methanosarcinales archaeon]|nr:peptidoglycan-binding protein [Methanosarcinales archaeon]
MGRPDFCSKDPELVKHLQKILLTLGYDPGTYGLDKDGVDGSFGKLTETAVNDFHEKKPGREVPISYLGVK